MLIHLSYLVRSLHLYKKLMIHSLTKHIANWIGSLCETNRTNYYCLLLLKISLFIGPKRPRDKSSNCHINCLARAGRSILVTKFRADVLVPLLHSACPSKEVHNLGIRKNQHFVTFAK